MDFRGSIVQKVSVQYSALPMANMAAECVIAKKVGKVPSATFLNMIAKYQIVLAEDSALEVAVNVDQVGKVIHAKNRTALIRHVLNMEHVY